MAYRKSSILLRVAAFAGAITAGAILWHAPLFGAEAPVIIPAPVIDTPKSAGPAQTAVLSGGCFWGVQGVFEHVRGVKNVIAGYAGGAKATADSQTVSSGATGHAAR